MGARLHMGCLYQKTICDVVLQLYAAYDMWELDCN